MNAHMLLHDRERANADAILSYRDGGSGEKFVVRLVDDLKQQCGDFVTFEALDAQTNHGRGSRILHGEQLMEIRVVCDDNRTALSCEVQNRLIGGSRESEITDVIGTDAR